VLDEMQIWEQEIFEKEYVDMNWYKGKQTKHVKEMEVARKKAGNGLPSRSSGLILCAYAFVGSVDRGPEGDI
jgi:5'-3' exoribonuclease 1